MFLLIETKLYQFSKFVLMMLINHCVVTRAFIIETVVSKLLMPPPPSFFISFKMKAVNVNSKPAINEQHSLPNNREKPKAVIEMGLK